MGRFHHLFLLVAVIARLGAETPPCGIAVVRPEGSNVDERFVPAPPEQVKFALLRALPALASKVDKDDGFHIEAKTDIELWQIAARRNIDAGVRGSRGAWGTFIVDIRQATQDEVRGALLHIEFHKNAFRGHAGSDGNAHPLAEETACLAKLLSSNDPASNPRGLENAKETGSPHAVTLPDATPVKVLLRDPLYSKKLEKNSAGQTVQFEVAEDVVVDGAVLVRRGALAIGHFTKVDKAKGYGRHADVEFVFDVATAVDGQTVPVTGAAEKARGGRTNNTFDFGVLGLFAKGNEALIRAGTAYDLEVSGQHTIQARR